MASVLEYKRVLVIYLDFESKKLIDLYLDLRQPLTAEHKLSLVHRGEDTIYFAAESRADYKNYSAMHPVNMVMLLKVEKVRIG